MSFRRDHLTRIARAPAKLNLYLEVLGQRSDGFHEIETLMAPISLYDSLSFTPRPQPASGILPIELAIHSEYPARIPCTTAGIPIGSDNLVVRALERLRESSGTRQGARVELFKRIPAGAGMGGGSSDAATALKLANVGWQIHWPLERLWKIAAEIGSDVPFFLGRSAAICRGRGEAIESVAGLPNLHFVIVQPPESLNTAEVYAAHDRLAAKDGPATAGQARDVVTALASKNWRCVAAQMHNRLQDAAASISPWVERLRKLFDGLGCLAHQLTGSGSAYFGICRHGQQARRLAAVLKSQRIGPVYATRSGS